MVRHLKAIIKKQPKTRIKSKNGNASCAMGWHICKAIDKPGI